jgi:hypothetical protein
MSEPKAPVLVEAIPAQIINEGAAFGPLNLNKYIQSPNEESGVVFFRAEIANGEPLPKGLICTANGTVSGIPAEKTQGQYEIVVTAENDSGIPLVAKFTLTIKERIALATSEFIASAKKDVWNAVLKDLPIPDIGDILNRPITQAEIYYLLQRFATLIIWDVYNLDPPGELKLMTLEGANPHYNFYDRGSCIVAAPKDLYSYERTLEDALQAARALSREAYKRGWVIEFAGFDKMVRAAWIELQLLGDKHGKQLEILHYTPTPEDLKIYAARAQAPGLKL